MRFFYRSRRQEAEGAYTFRFESNGPIDWVAGQSIGLELSAGYDTHERRFTIVSAPYERDICITTRISDSPFKQALAALQSGQPVDAFRIEGTFVWSPTDGHKLLCASGIGITPYISMLRQLDHEGAAIDATLLYANRTNDIAFAAELKEIRSKHPEFTVVLFIEQRLSLQLIASQRPEFIKDMVYLSGPSAMVDELSSQLLQEDLPEPMLMRDWFTGRTGWDAL